MTFEQLHHLVAAAADVRLSPIYPAYELRGGFLPFSRRSRSLDERQGRVLIALRQLGWPVFLRTSEDPTEAETPGSWAHAARETWGVPRQVESRQLLDSFLVPGNWQLYLALEAVDPSSLPDLFRGPLSDAFAVIEGLGIPALIDAFHDNSE